MIHKKPKDIYLRYTSQYRTQIKSIISLQILMAIWSQKIHRHNLMEIIKKRRMMMRHFSIRYYCINYQNIKGRQYSVVRLDIKVKMKGILKQKQSMILWKLYLHLAVNIGRTQFDNFLCFSNRKFQRHAIYQTIFTTVRKMCFSNLLQPSQPCFVDPAFF